MNSCGVASRQIKIIPKGYHNLKYIEKVADSIGSLTHAGKRVAGAEKDASTTTYTVSDLFAFVNRHDPDFRFNPAAPSTLNKDGTPKNMPPDAEDYGYVNMDGQYKSKDNIGTFNRGEQNPLYDEDLNLRDAGYHAGDLGKAEYLHQQGGYRGTGHFGTGTYGKRPQHAVDFSGYNMFRVRRDSQGYDLHRGLRYIDGSILDAVRKGFIESNISGESPASFYDVYDNHSPFTLHPAMFPICVSCVTCVT